MDTNNNTAVMVDIAVHDVATHPVQLGSGPWVCSITTLPSESAFDMDLAISVTRLQPAEQPYPQHESSNVDRYTQLCIVKTSNTDPDSLVMMMPIRNPQQLFSGMQGILFISVVRGWRFLGLCGLGEIQGLNRSFLSHSRNRFALGSNVGSVHVPCGACRREQQHRNDVRAKPVPVVVVVIITVVHSKILRIHPLEQ